MHRANPPSNSNGRDLALADLDLDQQIARRRKAGLVVLIAAETFPLME